MSTKVPTVSTTSTPPAKTAPIDPLAGLPLATAKPVPASPAPAPTGTTVINLAQAKKRRKATSEQFKAARDFARKATGYDSTSPIWGKKLPEVLMAIEEILVQADAKAGSSPTDSAAYINDALRLNRELQKRLATNAVIGSQLR